MQLSFNYHKLQKLLLSKWSGVALIQALNPIFGLLTGIVLARGLGVEGYGAYAYAISLLTVLLIFAKLGMPILVVREVAANQARHDWSLLRGIIVWSAKVVLTSSALIMVVAGIVLWQLETGMSSAMRGTLFYALLLLPCAALTALVLAILQGLQKVVQSQFIELLFRPALLLLGVLLLVSVLPHACLSQNVMAIQLGSYIIALGLAIVFLFKYLPKPVCTAYPKFHARKWFMSAIPLTLIGGAGIINNQADILMLGYFATPTEVGVYRVAVLGSGLVAFGLHVVNTIIAPQISRLYTLDDHAGLQRLISRSARVALLVALPIVLIIIFAGNKIVSLLFGREFIGSYIPLVILASGQLVNSLTGSVGFLLNMTGYERYVARTMLFTAGLNIFLNFILIPPFGIIGAAGASAVSQALWNIILLKIVKEKLGINSIALNFKY